MEIPSTIGDGGEQHLRGAPRFRRGCEAYGKRSWFFSERLAANVMDGGRIMSCHIPLGLKESRRSILLSIGEGEHLEKAAVKGDKIFLDEVIPGFEVVLDVHLQKGTDLVVAVE
jgi:hypothetical protein